MSTCCVPGTMLKITQLEFLWILIASIITFLSKIWVVAFKGGMELDQHPTAGKWWQGSWIQWLPSFSPFLEIFEFFRRRKWWGMRTEEKDKGMGERRWSWKKENLKRYREKWARKNKEFVWGVPFPRGQLSTTNSCCPSPVHSSHLQWGDQRVGSYSFSVFLTDTLNAQRGEATCQEWAAWDPNPERKRHWKAYNGPEESVVPPGLEVRKSGFFY